MNFTAFYTKIDAGYMGQLLEWPEVITEGATLEECRNMLIDAAQEMAIVYQEDSIKIPQKSILIEPLTIQIKEGLLANVC